jgi:class 3 adenylate cyclase
MPDSRWSIRNKLLIGFVGLAVLVVLIVLYGTSISVEKRIRSDVENNFQEAGRLFERIQEVRFRQLRQTAILLADVPSLKAAITTQDTATVTQKIQEELRYLLDVDPIIPDSLIPGSYFSSADSSGLLIVTDDRGHPLGQMSTGPLVTYSIAERPGVTQALQGAYPSQSYIWNKRGRYFNVTTVPIWLRDHLLGALSYGFPIRQREAEQLATDFNSEVSYFVDGQLLAGSFIDRDSTFITQLAEQIHAATYQVNQSGDAHIVDARVGNETWMIYVAPMQKGQNSTGDIHGYYAITQSLTQALIPLNRLQQLIILIGLGAVAIAIVLGVWLTTRFTKPIRLLINGIQRLEEGDYSQEVPVVSRDELGQLTETFNNLVHNLRERLMMLKFVSEATQDAIVTNTSDIKLGGQHKEVTVFFSDIRGFTRWSEKRPPKDVIDMLNTFLRFQTEIVQENNGDIDKFVGDELVAVFQGPDREEHAVSAAIQIQKKIQELLQTVEDEIAVGIGINTGEVVMGAMGSEQRMDYTVLGNNVNLGARLCSSALPHQILISKAVYDKLERRIAVNPLPSVSVKGIEKPVEVYEVDWQSTEIEGINKELS